MFVCPAALAVKRPLTNSTDAGRYDSELAELNGTIAEIYESLPDDLHDELETSVAFRNLVRNFVPHFIVPLTAFEITLVSQAAEFESEKYHSSVAFKHCSRNIWPSNTILQDGFQARRVA